MQEDGFCRRAGFGAEGHIGGVFIEGIAGAGMKWVTLTAAAGLCFGMAACQSTQTYRQTFDLTSDGNTANLQQTATIRSGTTVSLGVITEQKPDCSFERYPDVSVLEQPKHGSVVVRRTEGIPWAFTNPAMNKCAGKPVAGVRGEYRSDAGYKGTDSVVLEVTDKLGRRALSSITINVY